MENKPCWVFLVILTLLLIGFSSVNLKFVRELQEAPVATSSREPKVDFGSSTFDWLKGVLLGLLLRAGGGGDESSSPSHGGALIRSDPVKLIYRGVTLGPNLTKCYGSLSDAGRPLYCCPPRPDSEQPTVDFKFPADTSSSSSSSPLRVRRPAHLVDRDYLVKYEKAVSIMKRFPSDHPHNFWRQANMHCLYCTGSYNQVDSAALFKIHRSWLFFPWHRMFLYFHERILRKLIGDETFALPYWNWDSPEGMVIPDIYTKGALNDTDRDYAHLPPQVADINYDEEEVAESFPVGGAPAADDQLIATNLAFMYNQMVSGAKKPELFMGCRLRAGEEDTCDGPGTIENAPHNTLHTWVGTGLNPERENMGAFYSAARDPIFYAHHANIDRLWTVWKKLRGDDDDGKPEFADADEWLDTYFYFYDENVQLVRVRVRDCLDTIKLGYKYEEVDLPWLDARPKPAVPPKIAREILNSRSYLNYDHQNNRLRMMPAGTDSVDDGDNCYYYSSDELFGREGRRVLDRIIRAKVQRPKVGRSVKEKKEEEEVLVIYGINVKKDMYVKFDVFVNNVVDETNAGPQSREFAGSFVNVRHGAARRSSVVVRETEGGDSIMEMKATLKLGISELLEDLEADGDESIWVTIVPRGGTGINTTVDGIRIEYMQ